MEDEEFTIDELNTPREMTVYWALLHNYNYNYNYRNHGRTKKNVLVLVLKVTDRNVKIVPLKGHSLEDPDNVRYIDRKNFRITGLAGDVCNYEYNDYLTCDSEVIRKHAIEPFRSK